MFYEVIFDLETKKFFDETGNSDPSKLGVSIVSLYRRKLDESFNEKEGELLSFWENEFNDMWKHFLEADRIIGFNSLGFDIPALSPYSPSTFSTLAHFDIMARIREIGGRRVSLNAIAKETLGQGKIDTGENATLYWQKGDKESLKKLKVYCEKDVLLTKDVYDFGLKNKSLKFRDFWNTPRKVEVDFSYPVSFSSKAQKSLF